jgi:hypothetical protein
VLAHERLDLVGGQRAGPVGDEVVELGLVLTARGGYEAPFIRCVGELATRVALVPWLAEAPVGVAGLAGMVRA